MTLPTSPLSPPPQTILFLAANPQDTDPLRLDREMREIREWLQRSPRRDQFRLEQRSAVRPQDLRRAMLELEPQIVHFSGHGLGRSGLVFEGDRGETQLVQGEALARFFSLFAHQISCVLLNGCYSQEQGEAIAQHVPWVIGMRDEISSKASFAFSQGFYEALGAGADPERAYHLGCNAIELEGISTGQAEHLTPVLLGGSLTLTATPNLPDPPRHAAPHFPSQPPHSLSLPNSESSPHSESSSTLSGPIEVFIAYADEDEPFKQELSVQLAGLTRSGKVSLWHNQAIEVGRDKSESKTRLGSAQIILLLISPNFIASQPCVEQEMGAMVRHQAGTAWVIPIILRPCHWQQMDVGRLRALPKAEKPVSTWSNRDQAWFNVVEGIRRVVDSLTSSR